MYSAFRQTYTQLNFHSSLNFVYKMYTEVCQNLGYILYTFVYKMIHDFCVECKGFGN